MDAEGLRQMAHAEIEEALVRFWARAGNLPYVMRRGRSDPDRGHEPMPVSH
jgi:hypothetical protein